MSQCATSWPAYGYHYVWRLGLGFVSDRPLGRELRCIPPGRRYSNSGALTLSWQDSPATENYVERIQHIFLAFSHLFWVQIEIR